MQVAAYISLVVAATVLVTSLLNTSFHLFQSSEIDPELASQLGSYIGGILGPLLSVTSILLLLATINEQRKEKRTDEVKNHALELLKYNRDTVNSFEFVISWDPDGKPHVGSRFFVFAKRQIEEAIESVGSIFPDFDLLKRSQIGYLIAYYGLSKESIVTLHSRLLAFVEEKAVSRLISSFSTKRSAYDEKTLAYGGHQSRLSSYFRQLYYLISEVHHNGLLSDSEKINLVKTVRVQLNDYEQAVLYYNTLTALGEPWTKVDSTGKSLVTRYELIKNLQAGFVKGFQPTERFADMEFEFV